MNNLPNFEIYEFYEPVWWQNPWAKIILTMLGVIFIVGTIYLILRQRKKTLTPGQLALQSLEELARHDFSSKKEVRKAYFALTSIIKSYLNKQFNLHVLNKTDDELITFIEEKQFHLPTLEVLKKIHSNALWVKFANYDMIKTQVEQDLLLAREIVHSLELLVENKRKNS